MSEARIEAAMVSIRLHLELSTLLTQAEVDAIAGDDAEEAIERLYRNGQIAKTFVCGMIFYGEPPPRPK